MALPGRRFLVAAVWPCTPTKEYYVSLSGFACLYVCMYVHECIYVCVYACTYTSVHIHTKIPSCTSARICMRIQMCMWIHIYTCIQIHILNRRCVCPCACTQTRTHTYTRRRMHVRRCEARRHQPALWGGPDFGVGPFQHPPSQMNAGSGTLLWDALHYFGNMHDIGMGGRTGGVQPWATFCSMPRLPAYRLTYLPDPSTS